MPFPSSEHESERNVNSVPGRDAYRQSGRRGNVKSSQISTTSYGGSRRRSVQSRHEGNLLREKNRAGTAPLAETRKAGGGQMWAERDRETGGIMETEETYLPSKIGGATAEGQDEDEVAGVVGWVREYQPFQSPEVSEQIPEFNIAVVGAPGVGKSTFVQKVLDLPSLPESQAAERKIPQDGSSYLLRLLEVPIDDVDIDDDDTVIWPDIIEDKVMPKVDGAIALYDVQDKTSFEDVPEVLRAIRKAFLPSVLISSKCDVLPTQRELDPFVIERKARNSISGLGTLQISAAEPNAETHKKAISMILQSIALSSSDEQARSSSTTRKRAQSNAVRPVSPRPPSWRSHARASSEYTGSLHKDPKITRHDSNFTSYGSSDRLKVPKEEEGMHRSFLLEESGSESLPESTRSSESTEVQQQALGGRSPATAPSENGATFDELVDRLLAQPTSKADNKFSAIFLALYRKFSAPGRLLEAIVERFEALENQKGAQLTKIVTQMRYLAILEQWLSQYPGDFAYPKTKRRMRAFVIRISPFKIFTTAANEISNHLDIAEEDDDTNWAYAEREREVHPGDRISTGSISTSVIDDPSLTFMDDTSSGTMGDERTLATTLGTDVIGSSSSSGVSSHFISNTEAAQRSAQLLQPVPRKLITKFEWRALMEQPDDLIAKELTRMDWIMFSSIRPRDLIRHLSSAEKARCKNLINVTRTIEHFNHVAAWVSNYILLREKPKHRALMLEKMMRIGRKLRELNNYNAVGAIIAGIKSSSVSRLIMTKELVPPDVARDWARLEILMSYSRSYAAYRLAWENTSSERIPYLPLHLRDLATAEQGNPTFVGDEKGGRVNWKKFEIMGEVVVSMQRAQGLPYRALGGGKSEAYIKELILDVRLEKDEDVLFERSVMLEPSPGTAGPSEKLKQLFKR